MGIEWENHQGVPADHDNRTFSQLTSDIGQLSCFLLGPHDFECSEIKTSWGPNTLWDVRERKEKVQCGELVR